MQHISTPLAGAGWGSGVQDPFSPQSLQRLQIGDEVGAVFRFGDLEVHLLARHEGLRIGEPAVQGLVAPDEVACPSAPSNMCSRAGSRPCGRTRRDASGRRGSHPESGRRCSGSRRSPAPNGITGRGIALGFDACAAGQASSAASIKTRFIVSLVARKNGPAAPSGSSNT